MIGTKSSWCNSYFPCPLCGATASCRIFGEENNPTAVICKNTPSDRPAGDEGDFHFLSPRIEVTP